MMNYRTVILLAALIVAGSSFFNLSRCAPVIRMHLWLSANGIATIFRFLKTWSAQAVRQFFQWVKESPQEWLFFDAVVPTLVGHVDLPELELTAEGVARQVIIDGHVLNEVKNVPVDVLVWSFMIPVEVARFWAGGLLKGDIVDFAYEAAEMVWGAIRADSTA